MANSRTPLLLVALGAVIAATAALLADRPGVAGSAPAVAPAAGMVQWPGAESAAAGRTEVAAARAPGDLAVGRLLRFAWTARAGYELAPGGGRTQSSTLDVDGDMDLGVVHRDAGGMLLRVAFPRVRARLSAAGAAPRELSPQLGAGTLVQVAADGTVRGYRFADGLDGEARNWVRNLVAAQLFAVEDAAQWTREEADAAGWARCDYTRTSPLRVHRTKSGYLRGGRHLPTVRGDGEAELDAELGWVRRVRSQERTELSLDDFACSVVATFTFASSLVDAARTVDLVAASTRDGAWSDACGADEQIGAPSPAAADDGTSLADLIAELTAKTAGERSRLRARLEAMFRARPDTLDELGARLAELPADVAGFLVAAVGGADTAAAARFLSELAGDAGRSVDLRAAAITSLFQIAHPDDAAMAAMRGLLADEHAPESLHVGALLAAGAFARRRPQAGAADVVDLLGREAWAAQRGLTAQWLEALGNSARPEIEPTALRLLGDPRGPVRAAAAAALRFLPGETATARLAAAVLQDAAATVRLEAALALVDRTTPAARAAVERAATGDASAGVRRMVVEALAARLSDHPDARRILERVAAQDASPELRQLAARALAS